MKERFRRLLGEELIKATSFTAISTLVKMLTGFISVKVVAVIIGPSGIALVGQLINSSTILLMLSTGGINGGITKYVAEFKDNNEQVKKIIGTGTWITVALSLLLGMAMIIFSSYFSSLILKTPAYSNIFQIFGCSILFYSLNLHFLAIVNGYKEFRKFSIISALTSAIGLLFSTLLVYYFKVEGALIAVVTSQSVVFLCTLKLLSREKWLQSSTLFHKVDPEAIRKLLRYSLMTLASATLLPLSQLLVRSKITSLYSLSQAGLWEGCNRISNMCLMILTTSLSVYYLPKISELKSDMEVRKEIFKIYKMFLPLLIAALLFIFVFKDFIIRLLFSRDFYNMRDLFIYQLPGDFFKSVAWVLSYQMVAKAKTKLYIITEIVSAVTFVGLAYLLLPLMGVKGANIAYALNYLVYLLIMIILYRKLLFK